MINHHIPLRWRSGLERSPRKRKLGVRILAATDPSRKTGSDSSTAKRVSSVLGDDHCKRMPRVTVGVACAKEHSLLNGHECLAWVKICSPSPTKMLNPYK